MTFLHKLAQRLARLWTATVIAVLAVNSCKLPPTRVTAPPGDVAKLDLSPSSLTLLTDRTSDFVVVALTANDDTVDVPVSWTTSGGSISPMSDVGGVQYARYRAPLQPGRYRVFARIGSSGVADSAVVDVSAVPVSSVSVSPASASVTAGQTVQLTAIPRDASGNPLTGRVITWATNDGAVATVSGSGVVTGQGAGTVTITATSEGQSGTATITVTQPTVPVASVSVTPTSLSLTVGQTGQLTATPRDASGNPLTGRVVTWTSGSAAVATVNANGLVTGRGAGTATITATSEGKSGTAVISVTLVPVASVSVTPATLSLTVGQTGQLTATPRDASGNPLSGRVVTWTTNSAAVATVNGTGLVGGVTAGSATITASSEGKSGSAGVTVTLPGGGTILFQEGFEDNAFASRAWYDNTIVAITANQSHTGTRALEAHFLRGATTPTWGGAMRRLFQATPTLYVSYWVKFSDNWVGSGQSYHPHEFLVMSDLDGDYDGPSDTYMTLYLEEVYQNGGIPRMAVQDNKSINTSYGTPPINLIGVTENRSTSGCNGVMEGNVATSCYNAPPWYNAKTVDASQVSFQPTPGPGYKGNWNRVEAYYQLNSIVTGVGRADGVMQYWFNGTLVIDRHDILYRTGARPNINFHQFLIAPYIGDGSPLEQYMWVDDLLVATSRP